MSNQATPRPWQPGVGMGRNVDAILSVRADERPTILIAELPLHVGTTHEEQRANRDLIVRAVNSHDALVAAMRAARALLARARKVGVTPPYRDHLALEAENMLIVVLDELDGKSAGEGA